MTQVEPPSKAVASGGPVDGSRLGEADIAEFHVTMADGSRHRYVRTSTTTDQGVLYDYAGRL